MSTAAGSPAPAAPPEVYSKRWWALVSLNMSLLIVIVGNTALNVAIPRLSRELGATNSQLQWAVAIYSLVFAGLLFTTAAMGDRFGRKGALQLGLVIFLVGSALASRSTSMPQIISCRAVMGVGAALIMPSTLSILVNIFPPMERQKAIAIWASVSGLGGSLGPIVSGWLLGHFWYGSVFLVNLPIIVLALVTGFFLIPKSSDPRKARLDPMGALLSTITLGAFVYGLIQAPEDGWGSGGTLTAFGIAVVAMVAFVLWERGRDEPMLDVKLFRAPAFSTGTVGMILLFLSMYGMIFLVTQYFQLVRGLSPVAAAARLLPMPCVMLLIGFQTPRITGRFGANRAVAVGMALLASGMFVLVGLGVGTTYLLAFSAFVLVAFGFAMSSGPLTAAIMSAVPPRRAGSGSAMNDASRELGAALGVAVMGSIAASHFSGALSGAARSLPESSRGEATTSLGGALAEARKVGGQVGADFVARANDAFVGSLHRASLVGGLLTLSAAFVVWRFLPHSVSHAGAEHGHHEGGTDSPGAPQK